MLKRMFMLVGTLWLLAGGSPAAAQQRQVTGTVTGANQAPLAGAAVTIAGTRRGTVTDVQGRFTLAVPEGEARLSVGLLGYTTQQVTVPAGQSAVTVRLQQDVLNLEGLVVTGQATTVRRQNVANAVAVVSAQELQRAPAQTVERALQGKIAGANISANSGAPGGGLQIQLRGVSSISGNADPLFVIDGVVVSNVGISSGQNAVSQASRGLNSSGQDQLVNRIADLNPNDIETIEVLKGASAAAIYGSKAANGVVIIRTKAGRAGAPRFNVSQRVGYFELSNKLGARVWTRDEALEHFGATVRGFDVASAFDANGQQKAVYDNEEAVFGRRDPSRETSLSVSGGTENTRYYIAGTALDHEGIAANTGYDKQSLQLRLDQNLGSRVKVGVSSTLAHSVASRGLTGNDNAGVSYIAAISFTPSFFDLRRQADGTYLQNPFERSNPAQTAGLSTNDEDVWRSISSASVNVDLLDSDLQTLRLVAVGGVDYFQQRNELYYPRELQFEPTDGFPGTSILGQGNNTNLNATVSLVHSLTPGFLGMTATTSAGFSYEDRDLEWSQIVGRNMASGVRLPASGADVKTDAFRSRARDVGLYIQEEALLFDERLSLTASVRADRSSSNANAEKYYYFPKAAAAYRLLDLGRGLDELKLRLAYGSSGNLPNYGQRFTPALGGTNLEGVLGLRVHGSVGDANLRPERVSEVEGGFDATLFQGNARLEFTAYHKTVEDFIISPPLAPSTGFGTYFFNGGAFENNGLEVMLEATPLQGGVINWVTRTTFARDRATVTRLDLPGESPAYNPGNHFGFDYGGFRIKEGKSPTAMWGYVVGADGKVTEDIIGDTNPEFRMGFANDFTFGGFTFSSLFDWAEGAMVANLTKSYYVDAENWSGQTGCGTKQSPGTCQGQEFLQRLGTGATVYAEDASYVKLREISLGYELPAALVGRVPGGVDHARITLSGRNVKTWTSYSGLDPEVSNFGNRAVGRSIDVTPFPPSRSFWLSLDLGF